MTFFLVPARKAFAVTFHIKGRGCSRHIPAIFAICLILPFLPISATSGNLPSPLPPGDVTKKSRNLSTDERELLQTEIGYFLEFLRLNQPKFAAAHLDIIRRVFPQQKTIIHYYSGVLAWKQKKFRAAAAAFSAIPITGKEDQTDILYYLFLCQLQLKNPDAAQKTLEKMEQRFGISPLSIAARIALARDCYQRAKSKNKWKSTELRQAILLAQPVLRRKPQEPQLQWVPFAKAEFDFLQLHRALAKQQPEKEQKPLLLSAALRLKIEKLRDRYLTIRRHPYTGDEAVVADFRLHDLDELLGE